ncbi:hypothetical protein CYMTET_13355 [Cymbomonas tetramitiformis]|uniref:ADP ribosyltransferase domain-containing protein n=1 Tax=Cymbomonas tetramitiformis TaxID=36881 RepID=A0AAE0GIL3_9CHLO|nr:hypothetical protein CYMTET_13355 [Cymbomonas tetramitiformis]
MAAAMNMWQVQESQSTLTKLDPVGKVERDWSVESFQPKDTSPRSLSKNPYTSSEDPTAQIIEADFPGANIPNTFEDTIEKILDTDTNATGFMRGPVRNVFLSYPKKRWEELKGTCPALELTEYRALRFYTENYHKELNACKPAELQDLLKRSWVFTKLFWWMHVGIRKLAAVQVADEWVLRWQKRHHWHAWAEGDVFESSAFMSTVKTQGDGSNNPPPLAQAREFNKHFGDILLRIDISGLPQGFAADVSKLSKFEAEGEVLLIPGLRFQVSAPAVELEEKERERWQATHKIRLKFSSVM